VTLRSVSLNNLTQVNWPKLDFNFVYDKGRGFSFVVQVALISACLQTKAKETGRKMLKYAPVYQWHLQQGVLGKITQARDLAGAGAHERPIHKQSLVRARYWHI
jgi:hypothetical protein